MKAGVLYGIKDIRYEEIPTPKWGEDEVLIKVKATGICGSDMPRVLKGTSHRFPNVLGHEFSGEIAELGKNVTGLSVGDKVTAAPLKPCGKCGDCLKGHFSQCAYYTFIGSSEYGSFAEYVVAPAKNVVKLPEGCSFIEGALIEPVTVGLHGLFVMGFSPMYDTAVIGTGTIGMLTLQSAKLLGARRVFAFDIDEKRLAIAKEYGADYALNTLSENYIAEAEALTENGLFSMVLETAGVPAAEISALRLAANQGKVMFIGTPHVPLTLQPKEFEYINRKELTLGGSWMSYSAPFPGREWLLAAELFSKGLIKTEKLIDRILPLSEIAQAFEALDTKGAVNGKIILEVE